MNKEIVLEVKNVSKSFKALKAVNDVSFTIGKGEVFGLLGPNGAGKTTTMEMIEGILKIDSGQIFLKGLDVTKQLHEIKQIIGIQLQTTSLYDRITVKEALELFGSFYEKPFPVNYLLELVSLEDKKNSFIKTLSGGQRQRLAIALSIVNNPEIMFLDEPTTGLDPQARRNIWNIIEKMKAEGKTILLTTHYMDEAEKLCDRIAIMDLGKIIALGTLEELIKKIEGESTIVFSSPIESIDEKKLSDAHSIHRENSHYRIQSVNVNRTMSSLIELANTKNFELKDLHISRATLEDVFLALTGKSLRD